LISIQALQLGGNDLSQEVVFSEDVKWNYEPELNASDPEYDIAFILRELSEEEAKYLNRHVRAHCLFFLAGLKQNSAMEWLRKARAGQEISAADLKPFLSDQLKNYESRSYGEKFDPHMMSVSPYFHGSVTWHGYTEAVLEGSFGDTMHQAVFWRGNIPVEEGQAIDFWLEYEKDDSVSIELQIIQFPRGSVSAIQNTWTFSEADLRQPVTIDNEKLSGPVFVSLNACGHGKLKIRALHDRYSRRGAGAFLPGGKRLVTADGEEVFTYFDPGDLKPPLCVYFSGYKTMEGFEGYRMMRRMGCPFLLISESRLEGGAFYLGSEEYESLIVSAIRKACGELGFSENQVVLSGLSMGTFAALYYAMRIAAGNVIVGKPLVSLGNVAENERLVRPGLFATSLDVLWKSEGSLSQEAVKALNARFWDQFEKTDWSGRTIYAAYMIEDDYDQDAYQKLLAHMKGSQAKMIGKGLHGRHNDDTHGIVSWFIWQYHRVLREEFGREQTQDE
jgi:accessory secretory protein Asp2